MENELFLSSLKPLIFPVPSIAHILFNPSVNQVLPQTTTNSTHNLRPPHYLTPTAKMKLSLLTLTSLTSLATAHFHLNYPTSRGFDANKMTTFPCGDLSQSSNRTKVPLSGSFPVELMLGHSQTAVEVLLSLGNDPGDNFNIVLVPTFGVKGLGEFCLPHVSVDAAALGVNVTDGMNATVQVQTNGDPAGGLYAVCFLSFFLLSP